MLVRLHRPVWVNPYEKTCQKKIWQVSILVMRIALHAAGYIFPIHQII